MEVSDVYNDIISVEFESDSVGWILILFQSSLFV